MDNTIDICPDCGKAIGAMATVPDLHPDCAIAYDGPRIVFGPDETDEAFAARVQRASEIRIAYCENATRIANANIVY